MALLDKQAPVAGQLSADLVVAGAGIFGLWLALKAARAGLSVILLDRLAPGQGASNGLVGALFPYLPERFNDKKNFQFRALASLPEDIATLSAEIGRPIGYRRSGRLVPITAPHLKTIAEQLAGDAATHWNQPEGCFEWRVETQSPCPDWLPDAAGPFGFSLDTLAARIAPRELTAALLVAIERQDKVRLLPGVNLQAIDPERGLAETSAGQLRFAHLAIAAGGASFELLEPFLPSAKKPLGSTVKGQAALIKADCDPSWPVIFSDGLYCVAHEGGHVAIGSTSENRHDGEAKTDHQLDAVIAAARDLVPCLRDGPIVERWAGFRPKAIGRDPLVGALPDYPRLIAMTGGFKISFGIAHRLADCVVSHCLGKGLGDMPDAFRPEAHQAERM